MPRGNGGNKAGNKPINFNDLRGESTKDFFIVFKSCVFEVF